MSIHVYIGVGYMCVSLSPQETGVVERLTEAGSHRLEQLLAQEEEHTETGRVRLDTWKSESVNMLGYSVHTKL